MIRPYFFLWATVSALALVATAPTTAQSPAFTLDIAAPASQDVTLIVQPDKSVPVKILRSGGPVPQEGVILDLTSFTNEQGVSADVTLTVDRFSPANVTHLEKVPFANPVLPVHLNIPPLPAGGKYMGRLLLTAPGQTQLSVWRFFLISAKGVRPATLVLDQNAVTLTAVKAWWLIRCEKWQFCQDDKPVVTVHARDKTGHWPIHGIIARLVPGLKAADRTSICRRT